MARRAIDVRLRDVTEGDLPILFEQQMDPVANAVAAFPARERADFMAHWARILSDASVIKRTILSSGLVAGNIVSFERNGQREVGYWLGREYWGQGIASKALAGFLRHVPGRPLYARVAKHNVASLRVLQKCGFAIVDEDLGAIDVGDEVEEYVLKLPPENGAAT